MKFEKLNCAWVKRVLKEAELEIWISEYKDPLNDSRWRTMLNSEFKYRIRETLHRQLEFIKGEPPKWTMSEFLSLCVIFHIEDAVSYLEDQIYSAGKESKYKTKKAYILNFKPLESSLRKKTQYKPIKVKGMEAYYKKQEMILKSLLQEKNRTKPLTPFNWINLVEEEFPYTISFAEKINIPEVVAKEFIVPGKLKKNILYRHYKFDNIKADKGVFPVELYSLKEALNFLKVNQDKLLARCFMNNVGFYCKISSYEIKKSTYFSLLNTTEPSYAYFFEGLERLHKTKPILDMFDGSIRPLNGDSPTRTLCKSEIIRGKFTNSSLIVPLQPSLAEICQGITEKEFILKPGQQITPDDVYFLKSDIEILKDKYLAEDVQNQLINTTLQDIDTARKREKNKKFAQIASKRKKEKAKERWEEPLYCALSIARDDPNHYFATDLAKRVARRKSIPGKLDTIRKKILQDKNIVKYLRQMKKVA